MRTVLTHTLVILGMITSLGAAHRPSSKSESKPAAKAERPSSRTARSNHRSKPYQVGRASWYGKHFHGKKTASGENYDMFQFTAAHPQLPLGTLVKVTNLRNRRWVVVRVNDRVPIPRSRVIDLSYGAAQMLELKAYGVERVRLDLVEPETVAMAQPQVTGMQ